MAKSIYTKNRFQQSTLSKKPHTLSAGTSKIFPVIGSNWLAVGDAAAAYDPLSSQGVYKALNSGRAAAIAIAGHLQGKGNALDAYSEGVEEGFINYLKSRRQYYQKEQRWPGSGFWKRRWAMEADRPMGINFNWGMKIGMEKESANGIRK